MPEMDGFAVLEQMIDDLQLRDLPVIVTSSLEGRQYRSLHRSRRRRLPMVINPVLLKARIERAPGESGPGPQRSWCAASRHRGRARLADIRIWWVQAGVRR
jgi:hypothetical protein